MASEKKKPLPFVATFTAGAIAGVSEILTFYPLDVVKTRMQLETGKSKHGLVGSFKNIIAEEGFGRLYRGLVPPLLLEAPKRAVKFAANDFWGNTYLSLSGETKMTQQLSILTGCSAGATESFVVVPFELVKIKLQDKKKFSLSEIITTHSDSDLDAGMVYISSWQDYQEAAEALYTKSPNDTRYCVKWKSSEGKLVLKITDNTTCLKFKTYSSIFLNRFEALNLTLMQKMQNRRLVVPEPTSTHHDLPPSTPNPGSSALPSAPGTPAAGGVKKKPKKKKK